MNREALRTTMLAGDERTIDLALDVAEAAVLSAELAPRVPDGNKFGHDWTIPNPVIDALDRLAAVLPEPVETAEEKG